MIVKFTWFSNGVGCFEGKVPMDWLVKIFGYLKGDVRIERYDHGSKLVVTPNKDGILVWELVEKFDAMIEIDFGGNVLVIER